MINKVEETQHKQLGCDSSSRERTGDLLKCQQIKRDHEQLSRRFQNLLNFRNELPDSAQKDQKMASFLHKYSILTIVFLGNCLLEFSLLLTINILLFKSSKLSLNIFWALILIFTILHAIVFVSYFFSRDKRSGRSHKIKPMEILEPKANPHLGDYQSSTIRNIKRGNFANENEKTKKLKFFHVQAEQKVSKQTNKNMPKIFHEQNESEQINGQNQNSTTIFVIAKSITSVLILITMSLLLGIIENPLKIGLTLQVILIALEFICTLLSFFLLYNIYHQLTEKSSIVEKESSINSQIKQMVSCQNEEGKSSSKPQTSISIEHYIQEKTQSKPECRSSRKIQSQKSSKKTFQDINILIHHEKQPEDTDKIEKKEEEKPTISAVEKAFDNLNKQDIKKSALKKNESIRARNVTLDVKPNSCDKEQEEQYPQRKKVEINSKKIEYFEYLRPSPANSIVEADQSLEVRQKSHNGNRHRYSSKYLRPGIKRQGKSEDKKSMFEQKRKKSLSNTCKKKATKATESKNWRSVTFK